MTIEKVNSKNIKNNQKDIVDINSKVDNVLDKSNLEKKLENQDVPPSFDTPLPPTSTDTSADTSTKKKVTFNENVQTKIIENISNPTLTLNDLISVLNVLEVCSKRGAFLANELKDVGTLYNRIENFVKNAKK